MNIKRCLLYIGFISVLTCNNTGGISFSNTELQSENFIKLILKIRAEEDNTIRIFYVNDSLHGLYNDNQRLSQTISQSDSFQTIEFKLPSYNLKKFRIDLGEEHEYKDTPIYIHKIVLSNNTGQITLQSDLIESFFDSNIYVEKRGNEFFRFVIDGKYDPYIESKPILFKRIKIDL